MVQRAEGSFRRVGPNDSAIALARGLGWFSIALGAFEVLAPRSLARALGQDEQTGLVRACGVREIATGIGILATDNPKPWIWGRLAGDALDLAGLTMGLRHDNPRKGTVALALAAVAGVTLLDGICAADLSHSEARERFMPMRDYSDRRGLPAAPDVMRGAARDFEVPRDMRVPEAMRPYTRASL
ncbi:MAG: cyclase dehydrase [Candidatus Aminicenantales bacterium]